MVVAGLILAVVGAIVWWLEVHRHQPGRLLPGDISFQRGPVTVYIPIVSCLVISILLSLISRWLHR